MNERNDKSSREDWLKVYREELEELNMPYDDNEIALHIHHRKWKSVLEMIHAHNWQLIILSLEWTDYLLGKRPRPSSKISKYVNPDYGHSVNSACAFIRDLVNQMCEYGEGNCPPARIVTYCSRSTATLIERLQRIRHSEHLVRADCAANKLFDFMAYNGDPTMPHEEYCKMLRKIAETFVSECVANAEELANFTADAVAKIEGEPIAAIYRLNNQPITVEHAKDILHQHEDVVRVIVKADGDVTRAEIGEVKTIANRLDERDKRYHTRSTSKLTHEQQNDIYTIWEVGQLKQEVKNSCNHKIGYKDVFNYYRNELMALGVHNADELAKAVRARGERIKRQTVK